MKKPYGCTFNAFMFSCLHGAAASLMALSLKVCLKAEIGSGKTADSVNTLLKLFGSGSMKFTEARLRTRPPLPPHFIQILKITVKLPFSIQKKLENIVYTHIYLYYTFSQLNSLHHPHKQIEMSE